MIHFALDLDSTSTRRERKRRGEKAWKPHATSTCWQMTLSIGDIRSFDRILERTNVAIVYGKATMIEEMLSLSFFSFSFHFILCEIQRAIDRSSSIRYPWQISEAFSRKVRHRPLLLLLLLNRRCHTRIKYWTDRLHLCRSLVF